MLGADRRRRRLRRLPAVALALVLGSVWLLSGCGGGSSDSATPSPSPTAPSSSSPAPSPTASSAPLRPAAPKDTAKAREAFARFVVDAWGYSLRTNDAKVLTGLSPKGSECKGCRAFAAELGQRRKDGWYVDFPGAQVKRVVVKPGSAPKTYRARAFIDIPASTSYFDDGRFRNANNAHPRATFDVGMRYVAGDYALLEFRVG